ncbi:MAG: metallophosphoesterase family protein [Nanopusillaceae archaeon]|jgi:Icc-related predicted phosphoesterase
MKIIVASDIHNDLDIIYKIIKAYENFGADYIILLGDIGDFGEIKRNLIRKLVEKIDPKKILVIPGNHETYEQIKELERIYKIREFHEKYITKDKFVLAGIGGGDVPIFIIDEEEISKFLSYLGNKDKYIIIFSHLPPKSSITSLDISGSESLRKFIEEEKKVILNVHGHIHEAGGLEDIINNAKIINVARGVKIIEIEDKNIKINEIY